MILFLSRRDGREAGRVPEGRLAMNEETEIKWVVVHEAAGEIDAEIIKGLLNWNGIECFLDESGTCVNSAVVKPEAGMACARLVVRRRMSVAFMRVIHFLPVLSLHRSLTVHYFQHYFPSIVRRSGGGKLQIHYFPCW